MPEHPDLERAVADEISAATPPLTPPFTQVLARRRQRQRRRLALAGATCSVLALTAGTLLLTGPLGPDATMPFAAADEKVWRVSAAPGADADVFTEGVEACSALPGVTKASVQESFPPTYELRTSADASSELLSCLDGVPGTEVSLQDAGFERYTLRISSPASEGGGETERRVRACLDAPGVTDVGELRSLPPTFILAATPLAADELTVCLDDVPGAELIPAPESPELVSASFDELRACGPIVVPGRGSDGTHPCADASPEVAALLQRELLRARPASNLAACPRSKELLTLTLTESTQAPGFRPPSLEVDLGCATAARIGSTAQFTLSGRALTALRSLASGEVTGGASRNPSETAPSGSDAALIEDCVGSEQPEEAPGYVGLTEAQARERAKRESRIIRVVGRDGECLGRDDDLRPDRVNLILKDGEVIWAGRF